MWYRALSWRFISVHPEELEALPSYFAPFITNERTKRGAYCACGSSSSLRSLGLSPMSLVQSRPMRSYDLGYSRTKLSHALLIRIL